MGFSRQKILCRLLGRIDGIKRNNVFCSDDITSLIMYSGYHHFWQKQRQKLLVEMDLHIWWFLCAFRFVCNCHWSGSVEQIDIDDVRYQCSLLECIMVSFYIAGRFCFYIGCQTIGAKKTINLNLRR